MKLSKAGEDLMHRYEGKRSRPYLCPAHIWTIGYGHVLYQEQIRLPMVRPPGKTKEDIPMKVCFEISVSISTKSISVFLHN